MSERFFAANCVNKAVITRLMNENGGSKSFAVFVCARVEAGLADLVESSEIADYGRFLLFKLNHKLIVVTFLGDRHGQSQL